MSIIAKLIVQKKELPFLPQESKKCRHRNANSVESVHKKVQRLMQKMGLFAISIRKKRRYSSYYGVQGKVKPDLIKRNFYAIIPDRHWFTVNHAEIIIHLKIHLFN